MRSAKTLVAVLSFGLVALLLMRGLGRTSPGKLSAVHLQVEGLADESACAKCHGEGESTSMTAACEKCHEEIADERREERGLHGKLGAHGADCGHCHREHFGAAFRPTNKRSFQLAGIEDFEKYDHKGLGFELGGKHLELECKACHEHARAAVLAEGQRRFGGLSQDCTSCHEDVHKGVLGNDCASCHGEVRPFAEAAEFVHDSRFPLEHGHANVACAKCHDKAGPGSLTRFVGAQPGGAALRPTRTCVECHDNPHVGAKTKVVQIEASNDCSRCHDTKSFEDKSFGTDEHAKIGVFLLGKHANADCKSCHDQGHATVVARRDLGDCSSCHQSPHRYLPTGYKDCRPCHDARDQSWELATKRVDVDRHGECGFKLLGKHRERACADCHRPRGARETPYALRYPGREQSNCTDCHDDPHNGRFEFGPFAKKTCVDCHDETGWTPTKFEVADHQLTAFKLEGAHTAVACNACHRLNERQKLQLHGLATDCASCHEDVHAGRFDKAGMPSTVQGRTGCARCHDSEDFARAAKSFDHDLWTGWKLRGAHKTAACARCHEGSGEQDGRFVAAPKACASCHEDPHGGQFVINGKNDCARCHDERSFKDHHFDHQRDSRFVLDGSHVNVACNACHKPEGKERIVRYRPLRSDCAACHATKVGK